MGKSYLPMKDAELGQWTAAFTNQAQALQASIGVTPAQIATLVSTNATWISALAAASDDATRSRPTIIAKKVARDAVLAVIRPLVREIQNYPGTTDIMRGQLGINVRKIPGPGGNPDTPYNLTATLTSTGDLDLGWKNKNAAGCVYMVYRQVGGAGPFESLGGVGSKKFTDTTIPAGTTRLQYQVRAVRPTGVSAFAILDVKFGNNGSEIVATERSVKLAA